MSNLKRTIDHFKTKGVLGYLRYKLDKRRKRQTGHQNALGFYGQFVRPGDLCFDVGANLGNRTSLFLELGARVVCVEPQEQCASALRTQFKDRPVVILQTALGERPGSAKMMVASAGTISTMSQEWIESAEKLGRFGEVTWEKSVEVPVTTLDEIIRQHGVPRFVKIDVEGYETQVLRGLSQPVGAVSFEFVGENFEASKACVDQLQALGRARFNYSLGESLAMESPQWLAAEQLLERIKTLPSPLPWGDIYADFRG